MADVAPIVSAGATLLSAGAGAASALMNKSKTPKIKMQAAPALSTPPTAPVQDDAALTQARRREVAARMQSHGRASTVLTDQTLGG